MLLYTLSRRREISEQHSPSLSISLSLSRPFQIADAALGVGVETS